MTWGEALRLTRILASDPSSHVAAAVNEWDRPVDSAALALMDLFDLTHQVAWATGGGKGAKPKPYPRPWPDRKGSRMKPTVSQDEVIAALRFAGHTGPIPVREG